MPYRSGTTDTFNAFAKDHSAIEKAVQEETGRVARAQAARSMVVSGASRRRTSIAPDESSSVAHPPPARPTLSKEQYAAIVFEALERLLAGETVALDLATITADSTTTAPLQAQIAAAEKSLSEAEARRDGIVPRKLRVLEELASKVRLETREKEEYVAVRKSLGEPGLTAGNWQEFFEISEGRLCLKAEKKTELERSTSAAAAESDADFLQRFLNENLITGSLATKKPMQIADDVFCVMSANDNPMMKRPVSIKPEFAELARVLGVVADPIGKGDFPKKFKEFFEKTGTPTVWKIKEGKLDELRARPAAPTVSPKVATLQAFAGAVGVVTGESVDGVVREFMTPVVTLQITHDGTELLAKAGITDSDLSSFYKVAEGDVSLRHAKRMELLGEARSQAVAVVADEAVVDAAEYTPEVKKLVEQFNAERTRIQEYRRRICLGTPIGAVAQAMAKGDDRLDATLIGIITDDTGFVADFFDGENPKLPEINRAFLAAKAAQISAPATARRASVAVAAPEAVESDEQIVQKFFVTHLAPAEGDRAAGKWAKKTKGGQTTAINIAMFCAMGGPPICPAVPTSVKPEFAELARVLGVKTDPIAECDFVAKFQEFFDKTGAPPQWQIKAERLAELKSRTKDSMANPLEIMRGFLLVKDVISKERLIALMSSPKFAQLYEHSLFYKAIKDGERYRYLRNPEISADEIDLYEKFHELCHTAATKLLRDRAVFDVNKVSIRSLFTPVKALIIQNCRNDLERERRASPLFKVADSESGISCDPQLSFDSDMDAAVNVLLTPQTYLAGKTIIEFLVEQELVTGESREALTAIITLKKRIEDRIRDGVEDCELATEISRVQQLVTENHGVVVNSINAITDETFMTKGVASVSLAGMKGLKRNISSALDDIHTLFSAIPALAVARFTPADDQIFDEILREEFTAGNTNSALGRAVNKTVEGRRTEFDRLFKAVQPTYDEMQVRLKGLSEDVVIVGKSADGLQSKVTKLRELIEARYQGERKRKTRERILRELGSLLYLGVDGSGDVPVVVEEEMERIARGFAVTVRRASDSDAETARAVALAMSQLARLREEKDAELARLREEKARLEARLSALQTPRESHSSESAELRSQLAVLAASEGEAASRAAALQAQIGERERTIEEQGRAIRGLRGLNTTVGLPPLAPPPTGSASPTIAMRWRKFRDGNSDDFFVGMDRSSRGLLEDESTIGPLSARMRPGSATKIRADLSSVASTSSRPPRPAIRRSASTSSSGDAVLKSATARSAETASAVGSSAAASADGMVRHFPNFEDDVLSESALAPASSAVPPPPSSVSSPVAELEPDIPVGPLPSFSTSSPTGASVASHEVSVAEERPPATVAVAGADLEEEKKARMARRAVLLEQIEHNVKVCDDGDIKELRRRDDKTFSFDVVELDLNFLDKVVKLSEIVSKFSRDITEVKQGGSPFFSEVFCKKGDGGKGKEFFFTKENGKKLTIVFGKDGFVWYRNNHEAGSFAGFSSGDMGGVHRDAERLFRLGYNETFSGTKNAKSALKILEGFTASLTDLLEHEKDRRKKIQESREKKESRFGWVGRVINSLQRRVPGGEWIAEAEASAPSASVPGPSASAPSASVPGPSASAPAPSVPTPREVSKFFLEVKRGDYDTVARLISEYPSLADIKGKTDETPLMVAAQRGHYRICKLLLTKEVDPNAETKYGETALGLATDNEIRGLLLQSGATTPLTPPSTSPSKPRGASLLNMSSVKRFGITM